jgi:serine/threonine protein kinase
VEPRVVTHRDDPARAGRERHRLRLVAGPGVVPACDRTDDPDTAVVTARGFGTVADVLAERGPLPPPECRGVGVAAALALARLHGRGLVHADVKPANLVLAPGGGIWLIDLADSGAVGAPRTAHSPGRGAAATLRPDDDVTALAVAVAECASGLVVDPTGPWSTDLLVALGIPPDLATDLGAVMGDRLPARAAAARLGTGDHRLPLPAARVRGHDPTPTVEVAPTALRGLAPVRGCAPGPV